MRTLIALIVLLATSSCSRESDAELIKSGTVEIWTDEAASQYIARTLLPAAKDEGEVRAQIAGILDSTFGTGLLLRPSESRFTTFSGVPAYEISGVSYANFSERECRIVLAFANTNTYAVHCFAPRGEQLPDPEKHIDIVGEASPFTEEAFQFLRPRFENLVPSLAEVVDKLRKEIEKEANQRLESNAGLPPPSDGTSTAVEHRLPGVSQP